MEDTVRPVLPVVMPEDPVNGKNERLESVLESALRGTRPVWLCTPEETENYFRAHRPKKGEEYRPGLFAAGLGEDGVNTGLTGLFRLLRGDQGLLEGYAGGVIADGMSDLYTKSAARELVFTANCAGCAFVGRPLVEATRTLSNFTISAQILSTDELTAYHQCAAVLVQEILSFRRNGPGNAAHFLSSREEERGEEMPGTLPADIEHARALAQDRGISERRSRYPGNQPAERDPLRLCGLPLSHLPSLRGARQLLLRRDHGGVRLSRGAARERARHDLREL